MISKKTNLLFRGPTVSGCVVANILFSNKYINMYVYPSMTIFKYCQFNLNGSPIFRSNHENPKK